MPTRREELEREAQKLETLISTCNSEVWKSIEKIAGVHMRVCQHAVMHVNHGNFQQDALDGAFTRGEYKVWTWLAEIREAAPKQLATIQRKLTALRKEEDHGQERNEGTEDDDAG